ncbi:hypothetical protein J1771_gp60 [Gordonia phage MelBins]|uniref:Uncharacterized protein n=1 Tax=Gordonia phage MelBins TaxID=2656540 RepID=A0A649VN59_9CAUD|nr:hypothetical protein J1771_gp60 [Gordonia phage MelBins]QGJ93614.1 hypothetical protein SEA_MELBINS_60 [Gordonia phage MelBins]
MSRPMGRAATVAVWIVALLLWAAIIVYVVGLL